MLPGVHSRGEFRQAPALDQQPLLRAGLDGADGAEFAALRGVEVRLLLPERIDHLLPMLSSFSYYDSLALAGIELWRYQPGFLHQKALLVDDKLGVGWVNVDYRSFHLNFELVVMVADQGFCGQMEAMLKEDFGRSRRVDLDEYNRRPWWFKTASGRPGFFRPSSKRHFS